MVGRHIGLFCNITRDKIGTCWPSSSAGLTVVQPCPNYFNGIYYDTSKNAYRDCLGNGSWAQRSNYSLCQEIIDKKKVSYHDKVALIINYLGHCISLMTLTTAFLIFWCLRSIRCLRNAIHWHLLATFILRNLTWFLLRLIDPRTQDQNKPWCRLVITLFNYFQVTNFFWMFVEGCYLHTAIVMTYSTNKLHKWLFICIGWFIPAPISIMWALVKLKYRDEKCWFGKLDYIDFIYQGPIILVLLANFLFLFNIVRILMTKLRASTTSETIQYRKVVKATLVLLPLLGITYMLFFINPKEEGTSHIIFVYVNSFFMSFQGFFVSVFYCFLNGEVRSALHKRWVRWLDNHVVCARVARAMSIPTSPSRASFQSFKRTTSV
uniref:corticotropin-releasing factor receptor 2-like isoform X2 n=1 Tax=Myxine glutinosa TaxID=7769 RepID=UPI0035900B5B